MKINGYLDLVIQKKVAGSFVQVWVLHATRMIEKIVVFDLRIQKFIYFGSSQMDNWSSDPTLEFFFLFFIPWIAMDKSKE